MKHADALSHRARCFSRTVVPRRPFLLLIVASPKGSLHSAWSVSPLSSRAAEFDGAHLRTESGPRK